MGLFFNPFYFKPNWNDSKFTPIVCFKIQISKIIMRFKQLQFENEGLKKEEIKLWQTIKIKGYSNSG